MNNRKVVKLDLINDDIELPDGTRWCVTEMEQHLQSDSPETLRMSIGLKRIRPIVLSTNCSHLGFPVYRDSEGYFRCENCGELFRGRE